MRASKAPGPWLAALSLLLPLLLPFGAGCGGPSADAPLNCASATLCEEVNSRFQREIDELVSQRNSCESREDCTSEVPRLGCADQATWLTTCAKGVRADAVQDFREEVASLEEQFCGECDLECHHDDEASCTAPIAKCVEGRCVVEFMEDL